MTDSPPRLALKPGPAAAANARGVQISRVAEPDRTAKPTMQGPNSLVDKTDV